MMSVECEGISKFARERCAGSANPLRTSASRVPKKGVSTVSAMALKPARSAARIRPSVTERS